MIICGKEIYMSIYYGQNYPFNFKYELVHKNL